MLSESVLKYKILVYNLKFYKFLVSVYVFISVSPCDANPCQNGGACSVDSNNKAVCDCKGEYEGYYCTG